MARFEHDDFFEAIEARGGAYANLLEGIARLDFCDHAKRQIFGEDAVLAGGKHGFAFGDLFIIHDVVECRHGVAGAAHHALRALRAQHRADATFLIGEQQHL